MVQSVIDYYDGVSLEYRYNMGWDWEAVMREEGAQLDRLIAIQLRRPGPYSVLDCSCGIGTQAIGLALQGHQVYATDLSAVSIDCARRESIEFGVEMTFGIADFRELDATIADTFDVVLSCDNSFAHCLHDNDLANALASIKTRLNPGGLLLLSVRDYDALIADKLQFNNEHVDDLADGRRVVFQVWDWASDGRHYRNHQFLLKETEGVYEVKHFQTELRALLRDELMAAIRDAGYQEVCWHICEDSGYYQPIVTARNP